MTNEPESLEELRERLIYLHELPEKSVDKLFNVLIVIKALKEPQTIISMIELTGWRRETISKIIKNLGDDVRHDGKRPRMYQLTAYKKLEKGEKNE